MDISIKKTRQKIYKTEKARPTKSKTEIILGILILNVLNLTGTQTMKSPKNMKFQ